MSDPRAPIGEELTEGEMKLLKKLLSNWLLIPDAFKVAAADYVSQNSLLPISQVQGFTQFVAQSDKILDGTNATTTSTTYTDLSTVGPQLTGLAAGQYLFFYGFTGGGTTGGLITYASLSFNGGSPSASDFAEVFSGPGPSVGSYSVMGLTPKTLTGSNNTVKMQYKTSGGTSSYANCWLTSLRVGNP